MLARGFGLSRLDDDDPEPTNLDELLTYADPVDGVMASILAMESYDLTYQIDDHNDPAAPLSLITLHPKENVMVHGRMQTMIKAFRSHKVGIHMNMSLPEFLNLPRHVTKMILKDCEEAEKDEATRARDILNGLDKVKGK